MARRRKGQAALEYLTTYGWLLLIILIVAASMTALGLFKRSTYQQDTCTGFAKGLLYSEQKYQPGGTFTIVFNNNLGKTITYVTKVVMVLNDVTTKTENNPVVKMPWDTGEKRVVVAGGPDPGSIGSSYSLSVSIYFTTEGIDHIQTGTCAGKVEP